MWYRPGLCQCRFRTGYKGPEYRAKPDYCGQTGPKAVSLPSQAGRPTADHFALEPCAQEDERESAALLIGDEPLSTQALSLLRTVAGVPHWLLLVLLRALCTVLERLGVPTPVPVRLPALGRTVWVRDALDSLLRGTLGRANPPLRV